MKMTVLVMPGQTRALDPDLDQRGADHPADEGVGGAGRQPQVPGDHIPDAGAHEGGEDDASVHDRDVDNALADGVGDVQAEEQEGDEVEEGGPDDGLAGVSTRVETIVAMELAES